MELFRSNTVSVCLLRHTYYGSCKITYDLVVGKFQYLNTLWYAYDLTEISVKLFKFITFVLEIKYEPKHKRSQVESIFKELKTH